eukprot:454839-Hanusia_phi.AAC.1
MGRGQTVWRRIEGRGFMLSHLYRLSHQPSQHAHAERHAEHKQRLHIAILPRPHPNPVPHYPTPVWPRDQPTLMLF